MRPFKSLLEAQTGLTGQVVVGGDANALAGKLEADEVQLGVFSGIEFAWARQKSPNIKPLIIAVNRTRTLRAVAVVRADCKASSCADLRDTVAALPCQSKEHCRLYFERRCCVGGAPASFYREVTTPDDTEEALDDVVDGKAGIAVVDAVELEKYRRLKPGRARQLRNLSESEPFPCGVIAYQTGKLGEADLHRIRNGLIGAHSTPRGRQVLEMMRLTGFEGVPADYEASLQAIVKAYPPPGR
jgi:ABC-type phosphate/phosphonate transport system substrate-binding protein